MDLFGQRYLVAIKMPGVGWVPAYVALQHIGVYMAI